MTEEERLILESDYFQCGCDIHISVPSDICGLHKMKRLPHGDKPTQQPPDVPEDIRTINPNKKS